MNEHHERPSWSSLVLILGLAGLIVMADNWVVSPILPGIASAFGVPVGTMLAGRVIDGWGFETYLLGWGLALVLSGIAARFIMNGAGAGSAAEATRPMVAATAAAHEGSQA